MTAVLERQALAYKDTPQMGRSHGVHAEPITFGFKLLLWVEEMRATCSAWSGPGRRSPWARSPGPWAPTPTRPPEVEEHVCATLGLAVDPVSSQIVQRDRHAQLLCTLAVIVLLDKFATEIRHLQRTEVLEAEEPFESGRQGSSSRAWQA